MVPTGIQKSSAKPPHLSPELSGRHCFLWVVSKIRPTGGQNDRNKRSKCHRMLSKVKDLRLGPSLVS